MKKNETIELLHGDCIDLLPKIPDGSIDAIITDPPYGYLKNQKLDIPFNEEVFFLETKRVLKPAGFIVLFGRGTAFYRWNTILADLGFTFKEEIIWFKNQSTCPFSRVIRMHETISIFSKGKSKLNRCKISYFERRADDFNAIRNDILALLSILENDAKFKLLKEYIDIRAAGDDKPIPKMHHIPMKIKHAVTSQSETGSSGLSFLYTLEHFIFGFLESSVIKQSRDTSLYHPTQKPVRLMERLIALVTQSNSDFALRLLLGWPSSALRGLVPL